ncbi:MAG: glycine cleavage system protein GcvH [Acidimicrobiia bacterium]|jgi:glycine cleavage system H protein
MQVPEHLRYTEEHEWLEMRDGSYRLGITDYAQDQLGDIVFVELPEVGTEVGAGDVLAEVESTKSVGEVYAPLAGEITAINEDLRDRPELINSEPYGAGWIVEFRPADETGASGMLDAAAYRALIED